MVIKIDGEYYEVFSNIARILDIMQGEERNKLLNEIKSNDNPIQIKQYKTPIQGTEDKPDKFHGF